MIQLYLFLAAFALGIAIRAIYRLQRILSIKTALYPVTIILDVLWCAAAFFSFWLMSIFFAGGHFHFYMLCGVLAGFFLLSIWF